MNTKQKLTLGIAAIFMVTLTIVGVTYAYFVTRVNYSSTAKAVVQTASIGATFHDGKVTVVKNAMPNDKVYHLFAVENGGEVQVPYTISLATYQDEEAPKFVHSELTDETKLTGTGAYATEEGALTATCYMSDDAAKSYTGKADLTEARANCYNDTGAGAKYNNFKLTLYKLAGFTGTDDAVADIEEFKAIDLGYGDYTSVPDGLEDQNSDGVVDLIDAQIAHETARDAKVAALMTGATKVLYKNAETVFNAPYSTNTAQSISMTAAGNAITIADAEIVPGKTTGATSNVFNYYILEIHYEDIKKNQNIENEAFVGFKVDMASSAITQG